MSGCITTWVILNEQSGGKFYCAEWRWGSCIGHGGWVVLVGGEVGVILLCIDVV